MMRFASAVAVRHIAVAWSMAREIASAISRTAGSVWDSSRSVISMADVLEHMPFPKRGLAAARELMEDNGILLISMPNMETMIWNIWDRVRQNPYITEIEHYHNFSRTRLYALLAEFGFAPRRYGISTRYRACMEIVAQKL